MHFSTATSSTMRYRSRPTTWTASVGNNPPFTGETVREIFTDPGPGPGPCDHLKSSLTSYDLVHRSSGERLSMKGATGFVWENYSFSPSRQHLLSHVSTAMSSFDWGKLPSSSEFGLIQFFAELDDTIGIFALKFWKSLSYGSVTWGLMPFVSELKALLKSIENLSADLSQFSYEDSQNVQVPMLSSQTPGLPYYFETTYNSAKLRKTGSGDISFQHPGSIFLDQIGFQPDLATAWDLIPLSFVVDYFLPIGDFLDSLRSGGWVQVMYFTGWVTLKYDFTVKHYNTDYIPSMNHSYDAKGFVRVHSNDVFTVENEAPTLEAPSFRELFNTLYILLGSPK